MTAVLWIAGGASVICGLALLIVGARYEVRFTGPLTPPLDISTAVLLRLSLAVGMGLVVLLATSWPAGAAVVAGGAALAPDFVSGGRARRANIERARAIAEWTAMLRDLTIAGSGLSSAITASSDRAPVIIRRAVQRLSVDQTAGLVPALRRFADTVDDQLCDLVANVLVFAGTGQSARLGDALDRLAADIDDEAESLERVEDGRARTRASARWVAAVAIFGVVAMVTLNRPWLAAYETARGQVALTFWGSLFVGMLWMLARMDRPRPRPRLHLADPREEIVGWS